MDGVVLRPGEGESLFGGRIVLKATFEQLCITESHFPDARDGASPHYHEHHADSFYVLEGGMAVLVHDEEKQLDAGAFACAPPEVVHGFRTTSKSVFLNFHTPDGGFADNLRARNRREEGGFDSVDAEAGSGKPPTEAVYLRPGEGEHLETDTRVATIKVGREELALIEFEIGPGFEGPDPHSHDDHIDSFYVLDGEVDFFADGKWLRLPAGSYFAAPLGFTHAFANKSDQRARLLNIHAPSVDFHDRLREMS
jgi:quercetin dioxygenase-like cupin family protein